MWFVAQIKMLFQNDQNLVILDLVFFKKNFHLDQAWAKWDTWVKFDTGL
jgi:hypothetical protein